MQATRSVASNPVVRYVADALRFYMEFHATYDGFYGAFIHDPLAVAAALDRVAGHDRGAVRGRRDAWRAHGRDDRRGPAATHRQATEPRRGGGRRRRDVPRSPGRTCRRAGGGPDWTCHARGGACSPWHRTRRDEEDPMDLNWLTICAEGQTDGCIPTDPARLSRRPDRRRDPVRDRRASVARPDDRRPDTDAGRHRDQHRGRLDRHRAPSADLPRFDRDRARRRPGGTVGGRADRHPVEPHLVDPAGAGRRRPDGRLLRPGRRASSA